MDDAVIPECYIDTNLIETIVHPQKRGNQHGYNHQKGCGTVASRMQKKFSDRFALGIIDKDKHQIDYLKEFTEEINTGSLILHKHKKLHHYIIQICPAMEEFILTNAEAVGETPGNYGLPDDFDRFRDRAKKINSKYDPNFKDFFNSLKNKSAPDFVVLAKWVQYLKDKNYKADIEEIRNL